MNIFKRTVPFLTVCAFGCAGHSADSGVGGGDVSPSAVVQMTGNHSFNPVTVAVPPGGTVQWKNTDSAHHTVTSDTGVFNSDPQFGTGVPGGDTFEFTVPVGTASGTVFFYHCEFHGSGGNGTHIGTGMAGSVTVQ